MDDVVVPKVAVDCVAERLRLDRDCVDEAIVAETGTDEEPRVLLDATRDCEDDGGEGVWLLLVGLPVDSTVLLLTPPVWKDVELEVVGFGKIMLEDEPAWLLVVWLGCTVDDIEAWREVEDRRETVERGLNIWELEVPLLDWLVCSLWVEESDGCVEDADKLVCDDCIVLEAKLLEAA